jgi:hypothetical protein
MINSDFLNNIAIKNNKIYPVLEIFRNLEKSAVLKMLMPGKKERMIFLKRHYVKFDRKCSCCNVLNGKHIIFPYNYWNKSSPESFYLDIIHELTHCWQKEKENIDFLSLDKKFYYWENPKEIEAYVYELIEAKHIGLSIKKFEKYIKENDFLSAKERKMLFSNIKNSRLNKIA